MSIPSRDHTGREFKTRRAMAEAWGINPVTLADRLERGCTIEEALTMNHGNVVFSKDHLGRTYKSIREMATAWNLPYSTVAGRLERGLPIEDVLKPSEPKQKPRPMTDHQGRTFPSLRKMAAAWGLNVALLRYRLKRGWTVEDALTRPVQAQVRR